MRIKLLEPLNVPHELIEELAEPIKAQGHEFVYYKEKTTDLTELIQRSKDADVVMIANNPYPTEVIDQAENLQYINVAFTGVDHVGLAAAKHPEILLSNAAGYANQAVAELCVGLTLDLYRKITQGNTDIRDAHFPGPFQGGEINGKTVGVIGTGKIGLVTAQLYKAFGAKLIAYDPYPNLDAASALEIEYLTLDEVLTQADIVTLHLPLLPSTQGLISAEKFQLMKQSAILINCARGPIVDNAALSEALNTGQIAGAGIDVFDMEPPLPADYPLLDASNAILTPHIGFLTNEAMVKRARIAFDNILAFLAGSPQNLITK